MLPMRMKSILKLFLELDIFVLALYGPNYVLWSSVKWSGRDTPRGVGWFLEYLSMFPLIGLNF